MAHMYVTCVVMALSKIVQVILSPAQWEDHIDTAHARHNGYISSVSLHTTKHFTNTAPKFKNHSGFFEDPEGFWRILRDQRSLWRYIFIWFTAQFSGLTGHCTQFTHADVRCSERGTHCLWFHITWFTAHCTQFTHTGLRWEQCPSPGSHAWPRGSTNHQMWASITKSQLWHNPIAHCNVETPATPEVVQITQALAEIETVSSLLAIHLMPNFGHQVTKAHQKKLNGLNGKKWQQMAISVVTYYVCYKGTIWRENADLPVVYIIALFQFWTFPPSTKFFVSKFFPRPFTSDSIASWTVVNSNGFHITVKRSFLPFTYAWNVLSLLFGQEICCPLPLKIHANNSPPLDHHSPGIILTLS